MRGTLDGLAAELRWSRRRIRLALEPAIRAGMVEANEAVAYIGLPNFLRYNEPENPNVVKGAWVEALSQIPACPERRALIRRCRKYLSERSEKFRAELPQAIWEAFSEGLPEGSPQPFGKDSGKQEQEPEPELEQEQEQSPHSPSFGLNGNAPPWPSPAALIALWNEHAPSECPRVRDVTEGRARAAREALRERPTLEYWTTAVGEIRKSSFLRGLNKSPGHENWRADFDWFLRSKDKTPNYVRVAEGAFRDRAIDEADE